MSLLFAVIIALTLGSCASSDPASAKEPEEMRGIWVTRWDFSTPEDIAVIMANIKDAGLNTVFFQVRGNGTVFYPSSIEPLDVLWKPGKSVDALETAVREAKKHGLKIHAWMNVMPAWRGETDPSDPKQIVKAHSDWLMVTSTGQRMKPVKEDYVFVTPSLPAVREHLSSIAVEIASKYKVDGVHMDYIRFPNKNVSYDSASLAEFKSVTGKTPKEMPDNWDEFRRRQITQVVRDIRRALKPYPAVKLSAATWGDYEIGRDQYLQDPKVWMEGGLIDFAAPMIYTTVDKDFSRRVQTQTSLSKGFPIYAGIGAYKFTEAKKPYAQIGRQIRLSRDAGCNGFVLFAYKSFFPNNKMDEYGKGLKAELKAR